MSFPITKNKKNIAHSINAFPRGENPSNSIDWEFREPQTDERQGMKNASLKDFANIKKYSYFWNGELGECQYGEVDLK